MESRQPNPALINEYIDTLEIIKPPINQDDILRPTLGNAIALFLKQIKYINGEWYKDGIHVEKDLFPVIELLQNRDNLQNIELFYQRILTNQNANSSVRNRAITAITTGVTVLVTATAVAFFSPAVLGTAVVLYGTCAAAGGSALMTSAGICVGINNKCMREGLIKSEICILHTLLDELKHVSYDLFTQARLQIMKMDAQVKNLDVDDIFEKSIEDIDKLSLKDNVKLSDIKTVLETTKDNLVGKNADTVVKEVEILLEDLKGLDLVSEMPRL